jgi:hypothetical protein
VAAEVVRECESTIHPMIDAWQSVHRGWSRPGR